MVWLADAVVGRGESEGKAQTTNQLKPVSPIAEKCSTDQPIRTESTESITDFSFFRKILVPVAKEILRLKQGLLGTNLAANGVIFQPLLRCLIRLYIIMTKLSQISCLVLY